MRSPGVGGSAVLNVLDTAWKHVATGRYFRVFAQSEPQRKRPKKRSRVLWESSIAWGQSHLKFFLFFVDATPMWH